MRGNEWPEEEHKRKEIPCPQEQLCATALRAGGMAGAEGSGAQRLPKSPWMEEAMSEEGQEENRQKDRQQDLLDNFLYAFGAHGQMPHEAWFCVKKIIGVGWRDGATWEERSRSLALLGMTKGGAGWRRADILECGGSPPLLRLTLWRHMNRLREMGSIAKAGASSRTPKHPKSTGKSACATRHGSRNTSHGRGKADPSHCSG